MKCRQKVTTQRGSRRTSTRPKWYVIVVHVFCLYTRVDFLMYPAQLDELSRLALDEWRERGYTNAARSLRRQTVLIDTLIKAKDIKGIGDSIGSKIVEIVRTGIAVSTRSRPQRHR